MREFLMPSSSATPQWHTVDAWLGIIVGAANGEHIAIGQANNVRAEQGAVVVGTAIGIVDGAVQGRVD